MRELTERVPVSGLAPSASPIIYWIYWAFLFGALPCLLRTSWQKSPKILLDCTGSTTSWRPQFCFRTFWNSFKIPRSDPCALGGSFVGCKPHQWFRLQIFRHHGIPWPSHHALAMIFLPWPHTSVHGNQRFVDVTWPSKFPQKWTKKKQWSAKMNQSDPSLVNLIWNSMQKRSWAYVRSPTHWGVCASSKCARNLPANLLANSFVRSDFMSQIENKHPAPDIFRMLSNLGSRQKS